MSRRPRKSTEQTGGDKHPALPGQAEAGQAEPGQAIPRRPGLLYVVATPIGNLADVTFRALETLRSVSLVAAEDTRTTQHLLARYDIRARLISYHARNTRSRTPELLAHLRGGEDLAVVTDAGTPGVSDPGQDLVAAWAAEGGVVVPVPGPSAVLAAVAATGIAGPRWSFEGFLPRSGRERHERVARMCADDRGSVLYEAPQRVVETLEELAAECEPERPAALCRELTKLHEEIVRDSLRGLAARAGAGEIVQRGEMVIVVGEWHAARGDARRGGPQTGADKVEQARDEVERLVAGGTARGAAARQVADERGIPRRRLYGADLARRGSGNDSRTDPTTDR